MKVHVRKANLNIGCMKSNEWEYVGLHTFQLKKIRVSEGQRFVLAQGKGGEGSASRPRDAPTSTMELGFSVSDVPPQVGKICVITPGYRTY